MSSHAPAPFGCVLSLAYGVLLKMDLTKPLMNYCESPGYCKAPLRDKQISVFIMSAFKNIHECSISYATKGFIINYHYNNSLGTIVCVCVIHLIT